MPRSKYRSTNLIIQTILEGILRSMNKSTSGNDQGDGIIKSHLIKYSGLKTSIAEKYLDKMEKAGYIIAQERYWGKRKITVYQITEKGKERYGWFVKITAEIDDYE
ncbi:MAG: transcriptional regulator [Candidatus Hodarchaeales archaeon]